MCRPRTPTERNRHRHSCLVLVANLDRERLLESGLAPVLVDLHDDFRPFARTDPCVGHLHVEEALIIPDQFQLNCIQRNVLERNPVFFLFVGYLDIQFLGFGNEGRSRHTHRVNIGGELQLHQAVKQVTREHLGRSDRYALLLATEENEFYFRTVSDSDQLL